MNKHEHIECPHELEYCRKCDIVYCLKCSKEWKAQLTYSIYPNTIYSYDIDSYDNKYEYTTGGHAHNDIP